MSDTAREELLKIAADFAAIPFAEHDARKLGFAYLRLIDELDHFVRAEQQARERSERLERELRATYDELNRRLGGYAPKSWDQIKAVIADEAEGGRS